MIKVLIVSRPNEIPALPAGSDTGGAAANLRDGNLSQAGLRAIHGEQAVKVAAHLLVHRPGYSAVVACPTVQQMVDEVAKLAKRLGPIGQLDIVSHGRPGYLEIGTEVLFEADDVEILRGADIVSKLVPSLDSPARVRLLGCKTGLERRGRTLLAKLGALFGVDATVYGTIERVVPGHFESGEFSQAQELLFSSEAAVDREAPTYTERIASIQSLVPSRAAA